MRKLKLCRCFRSFRRKQRTYSREEGLNDIYISQRAVVTMGLLQSTFSGEEVLPVISGNETTERENVVATETEGASERHSDTSRSHEDSSASVTQLSQDPMVQREERNTGFSSAKSNVQTAASSVGERRADLRNPTEGHLYEDGKSTSSTAQAEGEKQKDSCMYYRRVIQRANYIPKEAIDRQQDDSKQVDCRPSMRPDSQQKQNERQRVKSTQTQHQASKCSPSHTADAKQQNECSLAQTPGEQDGKGNATGSVNTTQQTKRDTATMQGHNLNPCKEMSERTSAKCNPTLQANVQQHSNCKTSKLSNARQHNNAKKASLTNQKQQDHCAPKVQQQQVVIPKRPRRPQWQGTTIIRQPTLVPSQSSHTETKEKVTDIRNIKESRNITEQEKVASKTMEKHLCSKMSPNNEELRFRCNPKQPPNTLQREILSPPLPSPTAQKQKMIVDELSTTSRLQGNSIIQQKRTTQPEVKSQSKPRDCVIDMSQFDEVSQSTETNSEDNFNKHSDSSPSSHVYGVTSSGHPRSPVTVAPKQIWSTCAVSGGDIDTCSPNLESGSDFQGIIGKRDRMTPSRNVTAATNRQTPHSPLLKSKATHSNNSTTAQVQAQRQSSQRVLQETRETEHATASSIIEASNSLNRKYRNDGPSSIVGKNRTADKATNEKTTRINEACPGGEYGKIAISQGTSTSLRDSSPDVEHHKVVHAEAPKIVSWEHGSSSFSQGAGNIWSTPTVREHETKLSYRVIAKAAKKHDAITEPCQDNSSRSGAGHKSREQEQAGFPNDGCTSSTSPCVTAKKTEIKKAQQRYNQPKQELRLQPQTASCGTSKVMPQSQKDINQTEETRASSGIRINGPRPAQNISVSCNKVQEMEDVPIKREIILDDLAKKLAQLQIETTGTTVTSQPPHSVDKAARLQRSTNFHQEQKSVEGVSERGDLRKPDICPTTVCFRTSSSLAEDNGPKKTRSEQMYGQSQHQASFELKKPQFHLGRNTFCVQKDENASNAMNRGTSVSIQTSSSVVSAGNVQMSPSTACSTSDVRTARKTETTSLNKIQTRCSLDSANAADGKATRYKDGFGIPQVKCEVVLKKTNPHQSKLAETTPDKVNGNLFETKAGNVPEGTDFQFRKSISTASPTVEGGVQRRQLPSKALLSNVKNPIKFTGISASESTVQPQTITQSEVGSIAKQQVQYRDSIVDNKNDGPVLPSYQTGKQANSTSSPNNLRNLQSAQERCKLSQTKPEYGLKTNMTMNLNPNYMVSVRAEPLSTTTNSTNEVRSKQAPLAPHGTRHADGLNLLSEVVDEERDVTQGILTTKEVSAVKQEKNFLGNLKNRMSSVFSTKKGKKSDDGKKFVPTAKYPSSPVMSPRTVPVPVTGHSSQTNSKKSSRGAEATNHWTKQPSASAIEKRPGVNIGTSQLSSSQPDINNRIGLTSSIQLPKGHVPEDNQKLTGMASKPPAPTTVGKTTERQVAQAKRMIPSTTTKREPVLSGHTKHGMATTRVPTKTGGQEIIPSWKVKNVSSDKLKVAAETAQKQSLNSVKEGKKESLSIPVFVKTQDKSNRQEFEVAEQAPKNQAQESKENQKYSKPIVAAVENPDARHILQHSREAVERSPIRDSEDGAAEGSGVGEVYAGVKTSPIKKAERKQRRRQKRKQRKALERMGLDQAEAASQKPSYWDSMMITAADCDPFASAQDSNVMETILEENEPELGMEVDEEAQKNDEDFQEIENPLAAINLTPLKEKPVPCISPQSKVARKRAGRRRRGKYEYSAPTTRRKPINCCCEDLCDYCRPPRDE